MTVLVLLWKQVRLGLFIFGLKSDIIVQLASGYTLTSNESVTYRNFCSQQQQKITSFHLYVVNHIAHVVRVQHRSTTHRLAAFTYR